MMQQTMLSVAGARPAVGSRRSSAVRCAAGPAGPPPEPTKLWDISAAKGKQKQATVAALPPPPPPPVAPAWQTPALAAAGVVAVGAGAKLLFGEKPYRAYTADSVGREYDAWTEEGILEYYWGEHIHLGYYNDQELAAGYKKKNFKQAKYDFSDKMLEFAQLQGQPKRVLDVGCGFGGTTRHLAAKFGPSTKLTGITLSPKQVERGTQLAKERGLNNVEFTVMDALKMDFPDNSFDLVWACESGEHMPDKKKYIEEMTRVLKPGGTLVIACWCQRDEAPERGGPLSAQDKEDLKYLYEEWSHPYFISKEGFIRLMDGTGALEKLHTEDWQKWTLPSWRHSIWVGVWDPWIVVSKPHLWYKTARDTVCIEMMHRAFERGLMEYGMMRGVKKA